METIKKEISIEKELLSQFPSDFLFFDIETLGFSPNTAPVYLIGILDRKCDAPVITLFFANKTTDEESILCNFYEYLKDFKGVITFNGEAFDIPFIKSRGEKYGLNFDFNSLISVDLYKKIRPLRKPLNLDRMNQKSLEEYLMIYRDDKYDGGKLINVYKEYELNGDNNLKDLLILHNFEDVKGMSFLLYYLNYYNLSEGNFEFSNIDATNPECILFTATMDNILKIGVRKLEENYHFKAEDYLIKGILNLEYGCFKLYHKNTGDYVYLPEEDIIIPKSLSTNIPKNRKKKATKENCYTKKEGYFFKLPLGWKIKSHFNYFEKHLFKKDLSNPDVYIPIDINKDSPENPELSELIKSLIKFSFS